MATDVHLCAAVREAGGPVDQTHGVGFVVVRHGRSHAPNAGDRRFLDDEAFAAWPGREPGSACIEDMDAPYMLSPFVKPL